MFPQLNAIARLFTPLGAQGKGISHALTPNATGTGFQWTLFSTPVVPGQGGQAVTGNATLTVAGGVLANASVVATPTAMGQYATLPSATTITAEGVVQVAIYNAGEYDYGVKDSIGTILGWIRPRTGATIGLMDNATAAGVWAPIGLEKTGLTAQLTDRAVTGCANEMRVVALDATRTCFVFGGVTVSAVVYDSSSQTWGSVVTVRASATQGQMLAILSTTNQVLVVSGDSTANVDAVTLTIAGTGITVNTGTRATAALASPVASMGNIITCSGSFAFSYARNGPTCGMRAISVTGTTPTVGAELAVSNADTGVSPILLVTVSTIRMISTTASSIYCKPATVAGSVLTAGTEASATTTANPVRAFVNGNGNVVAEYVNTTHFATIFRLTGTVEAASSVSLGGVPSSGSVLTGADYVAVATNKTAFISITAGTSYEVNILTDTAGTATAGTAFTSSMEVGTMSYPVGGLVSGSSVNFGVVCQSGNFYYMGVTLNCSGASPTFTSTVKWPFANGTMSYPGSASDKYGIRPPLTFEAGNMMLSVGSPQSYAADVVYTTNSIRKLNSGLPLVNGTAKVGASGLESWIQAAYNGGSLGVIIQRVEAAA